MPKALRLYLSPILCCLMLLGTGIALTVKPLSAQPARSCACGGGTCTSEYNQYFKFCCDWTGGGTPTCGCTMFISNCF